MLIVSQLFFGYEKATSTLKGLNLEVKRGELVCIQGRSGSGKSTLFYMLGGLLKPDRGHIFFDGVDLTICVLAGAALLGALEAIKAIGRRTSPTSPGTP